MNHDFNPLPNIKTNVPIIINFILWNKQHKQVLSPQHRVDTSRIHIEPLQNKTASRFYQPFPRVNFPGDCQHTCTVILLGIHDFLPWDNLGILISILCNKFFLLEKKMVIQIHILKRYSSNGDVTFFHWKKK